jgi:UDP-3-O-[3-hydroxymyristoyl] glucosamine N-acyltransferase
VNLPSIDDLALNEVTLADVAAITGGILKGDDIPVRHLRPLSADPVPAGTLAYGSGSWVQRLLSKPFVAGIVTEDDLAGWDGRPVVVHPRPQMAFHLLHRSLVARGAYPLLETRRAPGGRVAPSAVIHEHTWIGDGVVIGDHAVIMPNSVLDDGVAVQAGSVVGEPGFHVADTGQGRFLVPHAGGVILGRGVSIGANCCIDRSLYSTFTSLGAETMLDNLIHVAHDCVIGERCTLTAAVELSGSAILDDDVWLAPKTCCNQFIRFGRGAFTGTGAVVVRDVPPFTMVKGNPAKPGGRVCLCKARLPDVAAVIECSCGRTFDLRGAEVVLVETSASR